MNATAEKLATTVGIGHTVQNRLSNAAGNAASLMSNHYTMLVIRLSLGPWVARGPTVGFVSLLFAVFLLCSCASQGQKEIHNTAEDSANSCVLREARAVAYRPVDLETAATTAMGRCVAEIYAAREV